jgi:hypothetical protein
MRETAVFAEALSMVAVDDEDGIVVESQLLVLIYEALQKMSWRRRQLR